MKVKNQTRARLEKEIASLRKQVAKLKDTGPKLKRKEEALRDCVASLEEQVETRTSAERIINKQLHLEIEHRKNLETELFKEKQLLETVLNGITEQIILLSKDYKILWANKTFLEQFGCSLKDISGRYCFQVSHHQKHPCQPPHDTCPIAQVLKTGLPKAEIHVHQGVQGKFFSEVSAYPIKDKKGEIVEFVHIARDVSEQKAGSA